MESKIEVLVKDSLVLAENKFKSDTTAKQFEKAKNEFKELVSKGFAHERGNNLLSISDSKSYQKVIYNNCV